MDRAAWWATVHGVTQRWTQLSDQAAAEAAARDKDKGGAQQGSRSGEFAFSIKAHFRQRSSEGTNKPCAHQDPETPQRLRQNCV